VDTDVIGVRVELAVVAVGDDHLGAFAAQYGHQPADRLVEIGVGEVVGVLVRLGVRHAGVAIAQPVQRRVADDLDRLIQLGPAYVGQVLTDLRLFHLRVEDVALLPAGAAHEHVADNASSKTDSNASTHPLHGKETPKGEQVQFRHHEANPGPAITKDLPQQEGTKEERRAKADALNK